MKMFNGQGNFSTRFFGWKFRGILGNFFGGWEGIWSEIEGFAGFSKTPGILGSFIAAVWRDPKLMETQRARVKTPKIPATFKNPAKNPWTSLVFQFLKIGPSSRVGLAETVQSVHWKKIPTHEMIHRFSTPVQSKSNRNPKILQKPTEDQMLLPKNPRLDPQKNSTKTCLILRNFCRKKKLDSPGWLKGW
jgi:hypothetical protein